MPAPQGHPRWPFSSQSTDVVIALACAAGTVAATLAVADAAGAEVRLGPSGWLLLLIGTGVLSWRRKAPVAVTLVTMATVAVYYPTDQPDGPLALTVVVALYSLAAHRPAVWAWLLAAVAVLALVVSELVADTAHLDGLSLLLLPGWVVAALAVGGLRRALRRTREEVTERIVAVQRQQAAEVSRAEAEERLRIARDLHDSVGHHLSLIRVQATAALHGLGRDGGPGSAAAEALLAVKEASGAALRELRATVRALRQFDQAHGEPAPGMDRVRDLVAQSRSAGFEVRTSLRGDPAPLPAPVDEVAYRVVQEALTNVARHAEATHVEVGIGYGSRYVDIEVRDDGSGAARAGAPGAGLRGMAERVAMVGGVVETGPGERGFRVHACLPVGAP